MRLIRITHSFLFVLLSIGFAQAQNQAIQHYINSDNLPSNIVYDMEMASNGFFLFATDNGIIQFNGRNFSEASYFGTYKNNSILSLYKLPNQSILATTCDNKIIVAHPDSSVHYFSYKTGYYCFNDIIEHNNKLFSYQSRYIYHIRQTNNQFEIDTARFILPHHSVINSEASFRNKLYFVVNNSLFEYTAEYKIRLTFPEFEGITTACHASGNHFYIITKNNIYCSSDAVNFEKILSIKENQRIGKIFRNENNSLCFEIKGEGLFSYDLSKKTIIKLIETKQEITFIKNDHYNTLWVGTYGDGIFSVSKKLINTLSDASENPVRITDLAVSPKGKILIGTATGLMHYDSKRKILIPSTGEYNDQYIWQTNYSNDLNSFVVSVFKKNIKSKIRGSKFYSDIQYIRSTTNLVTKDNIYFAAWDHVAFYNPYKLNNKYYRFQYTEYSKLPKYGPDNRANVILHADNKLLIGCNLGLYGVQLSKHKTLKISDKKVLQIKNDFNDETWVVCPKQIYKLKQNKLWEQNIAIKHQLTFTDIEFMPDSNLIFIGTKSGVLIKSPDNEILINQSFGLLSQEVTSLSFDTYNNYLWIGTTKGLHYVRLNEIYKNLLQIPQPYCLLDDKTVFKDTTVHLSAKTKSYNFQYASLALFQFKNLYFRYRINDADWIPAKSKNMDVLLQNPGKYKLEIACSNSGLVWSKPIAITLDKDPFVWQTLFFKILTGLLFLLAVYLIIIWRISRVKKREAANRNYEKQINEFKFRSFSASVNPHFIFNSLNSLQYLVNANKPKLVNDYIKRFARLLRFNIDDIDQTFVSLKREIERIENYMQIEKIRFGDKINFKIHMDENLNPEETKIPGMILQPFVENSIKHGFQNVEKGDINIRIIKINDSLKFIVSDNGTGATADSNKRSGKGNHLVNSRLQVIYNLPDHQFIKINNDEEKQNGYCVEITIPLIGKH